LDADAPRDITPPSPDLGALFFIPLAAAGATWAVVRKFENVDAIVEKVEVKA